MAEIRLARHRSGLWPWLLAVVAIALAAALLLTMGGPRSEPAEATSAPAPLPAVSDPEAASLPVPDPEMPAPRVAAFLTFADTAGGEDRPDQFVAGGSDRLVAALTALVTAHTADGAPVRRPIATLQSSATRFTDTAGSMGSAGPPRQFFIDVVDVMADLRQARWPEADAIDAAIVATRRAATAIDDARPVRDQVDRLRDYFERSAEVLRAMSAQPVAAFR